MGYSKITDTRVIHIEELLKCHGKAVPSTLISSSIFLPLYPAQPTLFCFPSPLPSSQPVKCCCLLLTSRESCIFIYYRSPQTVDCRPNSAKELRMVYIFKGLVFKEQNMQQRPYVACKSQNIYYLAF